MTTDLDQGSITDINHSGGADLNARRDITIGGDVTGRDKTVGGDEVKGDKVIVDVASGSTIVIGKNSDHPNIQFLPGFKIKRGDFEFEWKSCVSIFLVFVCALGSILFASSSFPFMPASVGSIKIAILAPLSGGQPTFGISTRDGALMAIEEWNAKGGVLGEKIEAVIADSQCEADPAVNAANQVIDQDKARYIVGEVCSKASIPISQIANEKHVLQISPTSTNVQVTTKVDGSTKPYTFRACFISPFQGTVGAKFAMENLKAKTAFVLFDQGDDYVRGLAESFEAAFTKAGGKIVGKESYALSDKDFSAILAKVAEAKPDMIYLPDYYPIVNLVGAQAKDKGITIPMMGGDGWDSDQLDVKAADNGYYTNYYSEQDTRPIVQTFIKNYSAKYKDDKGAPKIPDALATLAYDATNLMLAAIEKAGVNDPAQVAKALEGLKYDAVSGTITFDAQHNPITSAVVIQVKDGKKQWVATMGP